MNRETCKRIFFSFPAGALSRLQCTLWQTAHHK